MGLMLLCGCVIERFLVMPSWGASHNKIEIIGKRERHYRDRSKSKIVVDFQLRTKKLRDRVRRILKTLAAKKFPTIPQLIDISNQEEDAEAVLDSNEDDVLEDDNETASIKKDAEIEKLK